MAQHNKPEDAWISIEYKVYDITDYLPRHPGGTLIRDALGTEATDLHLKYHNWVNVDYMLKDYYVGRLKFF